MAAVTITGLLVRAGHFQLGPLNLAVADGKTLALLGPSGSGKTTLLETLAGFHTPRAGRILLDGRDITDMPPEQRHLALMIQDYALFPHLSVAENVAFGLRYHQLPRERVQSALAVLGILHLAKRRPQGLSAGERQRVALARALVTEPAAFLLDEPLTALDMSRRQEVRAELEHFLREVHATCILVTHDHLDAFALADQMALMRDGRLQQVGDPDNVYRRPANAWAAHFLGMESLRPEWIEHGTSGPVYRIAGTPMRVAAGAPADGTEVVFRPEDVQLHLGDRVQPNTLPGTVTELRSEGPLARVRVELANGERVVALLHRRELERLCGNPGQSVACTIDPEDLWPVCDPRPCE
jgi:ABC-type Fe3+/spermidine/putrescine transport system ATPase subunit